MAGFLLTFFSGFGQSFLVSSFAPHLLQSLAIDRGTFGVIYSLGTLTSGLILPWIGSRLDNTEPIRYTLMAVAGLAISCFVLAGTQGILNLTIGILGLRFFGQGLLSHVSATLITRRFLALRGRALSLSSLGHPISEAVLPLVSAFLISVWGWRWAWVCFGAFLILFVLPSLPYLLRGNAEVMDEWNSQTLFKKSKWGSPPFTKELRFWILIIGNIIPGFILTAIFLNHGTLAAENGWSMEWIALGFSAFAISQIIFSLFGGRCVDSFGAKKLFPFYPLPLALGLIILSSTNSNRWIVPAYLLLAGVSVGIGGPLKSALWAENYDLRKLATLRSWTGAIAVLSTAASPPLLGFALDYGFSFSIILRVLALCIMGFCVSCTLLMRYTKY